MTEQKDTKRTWNWDRTIDAVVFVVLLAVVSALTLFLFYRQTQGSPETGYHSDMKAYILEIQGLNTKYSYPYPIFFKIAAFIHLFTTPEFAVALATMFLNSFAIVLVKLFMNRIILPEWTDVDSGVFRRPWLAGVILSFLAVSLFFISMLYPPPGIYLPGIKFKYLGVFTANPFHNATYMAARPFTILAFFWYIKLLPVYEKGVRLQKSGGGAEAGASLWDYVLFSLFLLLATMTKPSFTIVFVAAAGLTMLYRLVRDRFRNFVPTIQLGLCFVPTFIDLLYQYSGVFVPTEGQEGGIGFGFGEVWGEYCDNIPLSVCLAVGFPLLTLVLNFRELKKDVMYRFSWLIYLMGFVMTFFLYEKGFRKPDFNFSWSYVCGIFFCHLSALMLLLKVTIKTGQYGSRGPSGKQKMLRTLLLAAQWLAYLWHVVCGLFYFGNFMAGKMYY